MHRKSSHLGANPAPRRLGAPPKGRPRENPGTPAPCPGPLWSPRGGAAERAQSPLGSVIEALRLGQGGMAWAGVVVSRTPDSPLGASLAPPAPDFTSAGHPTACVHENAGRTTMEARPPPTGRVRRALPRRWGGVKQYFQSLYGYGHSPCPLPLWIRLWSLPVSPPHRLTLCSTHIVIDRASPQYI